MEMENLKNTYNFYKSPNYSDDRVQTSKKFTDEIIKNRKTRVITKKNR